MMMTTATTTTLVSSRALLALSSELFAWSFSTMLLVSVVYFWFTCGLPAKFPCVCSLCFGFTWFTCGLLVVYRARFHVTFYHIIRDFVVYTARHDVNRSVHAVRFPHIKTAPGDPFRGDPLLNIYYYSSSGRPLSISSAALRGTDTESVRSLRGHRGCPHVACCALEPNHSRHLRQIEGWMG